MAAFEPAVLRTSPALESPAGNFQLFCHADQVSERTRRHFLHYIAAVNLQSHFLDAQSGGGLPIEETLHHERKYKVAQLTFHDGAAVPHVGRKPGIRLCPEPKRTLAVEKILWRGSASLLMSPSTPIPEPPISTSAACGS
jgi:hypothetical protein